MSDTNMNKIKVRIQALLAKATSSEHEAEAEAFLNKANELLQQYQLDIMDLVDAGDPIIEHIGIKHADSGHAWRWRLYSKVAQLYGCRSIHISCMVPGKGGKMVPGYEQHAIGPESAIMTTDLMFPWIAAQVKREGKRLAPITGMSEQGQAKRVAAALIARIAVLLKEKGETIPTTAAGRNALVVLNSVDAKYKEIYPSTSLISGNRQRTDALSTAAANSIGLHRQTGGRSQLQIAG